MANITVTALNQNFDDAASLGLLDGEDITINGGSLVIDSDVKYAQNAAVIGAITISATLGGQVLIDGRNTWWIPFTGGSGNVPTLGTRGVQNCTGATSGATGEFLGVWTALGTLRVTPGSAMPSTGFIKFRSKVGTFQDAETIDLPGGASLTVNSSTGGQRGWIQVKGEEATTITVPRLGLFQTRGDWFELGTTNGADDQTFQYPITDNCPAIQIETDPGSGVYEWYLNAGSRWGTATVYIPTDARGKFFGHDNTTGIITIARRTSNSCGFKPASGCKVRIPNVIVSNSTSANWDANTINATLATRWDFTTTAAGAIDIEHSIGAWYLSLTSAFSVSIKNSAVLQSALVSNTAGNTIFDNFAIGLNAASEFAPLTLSNLFTYTQMIDCRIARYASSAAGQFAISMTDCANVETTRVQAEIFGSTTAVTRGNATAYAFFLTRVNDMTMLNCSALGGRIEASQCVRISSTGLRFADLIGGATTATNAQSALSVSNACTNITFDGFTNFGDIANVHPYTGILIVANSYFVELKNIGTTAAPYNCGSANACGLIASASVATDLTFRRIYTDNLRTSPFSFVNTVQGVTVVNVWGDGADSQAIAALNITPKGCRWTNSVTGQSSVYGRHWEDAFTSTTAGRILLAMNEPLAATEDQCEIVTGVAAFTSGGQIAMPSVGDQVIWTMPYFCLGYTSLANIAPTVTGTGTANITFEYQIDTGSGFSAWKSLTAGNLSGETISPSSGFRLKIRATTSVANTTNAITYIRIDGVTNSTDQQTQYPLPFTASGSISGLQAGSRLQIYNVTTDAEIYNAIVSSSSFEYEYYNGTGISAGDTVRIRSTYVNGATANLPFETVTIATATGFTVLASVETDTVYNLIGISGSTVTEFVEDYPNIEIDVDDPDGSTTVARMYSWFSYVQFTEDGIRNWFGGIVAEDAGNFRVVTSIVDLKIDNIAATGVQFVGDVRLYRDDGLSPLVSTTTGGGSIVMFAGKVYAISAGSGLTPTEQAQLAQINSRVDQTLSSLKKNTDLIPAAL